jgi:hypothetical protein
MGHLRRSAVPAKGLMSALGQKQTFGAAVKKSLFDHLCLLRVAGSKTHGAGVERLIEQLN